MNFLDTQRRQNWAFSTLLKFYEWIKCQDELE